MGCKKLWPPFLKVHGGPIFFLILNVFNYVKLEGKQRNIVYLLYDLNMIITERINTEIGIKELVY